MTVKQKQCLLAYLGYYAGQLDGLWGEQSKRATEAFQRDYQLTVDGVFGLGTEQRIREVVASGEDPVMADANGGVNLDTGRTDWESNASRYLQTDGCYHIPRGVDVQLSRNLWAHEIHCCGNGCCKESVISKRMVDTFQCIRDEYDGPIQITEAGGSGYRCRTHNTAVNGAWASLHTTGNALDLHAADKNRLLVAANKHVTDGEIGVYSWGIHVGVWNRGYVNRFTSI